LGDQPILEEALSNIIIVFTPIALWLARWLPPATQKSPAAE
jgi:hypothetical protein